MPLFGILRGSFYSRPPLWSTGQSSWLQIQRSGLDSRRYHIFWEVVVLERCPLSLVSTIDELLERKMSGSGLEIREYGCRDPSRWPRGTLYPQKLALSGGRSVGIVHSRTQATEFSFSFYSQIALNILVAHSNLHTRSVSYEPTCNRFDPVMNHVLLVWRRLRLRETWVYSVGLWSRNVIPPTVRVPAASVTVQWLYSN
jgi:hypothetical protein